MTPLDTASEFAALSLLAAIQGLTEFLPISSSGHLVLAQVAMGLSQPALVVDIALHLGTLLSVVLVYRKDLLQLLRSGLRGELGDLLWIGVGTLPAGVIGLLFEDRIEEAFHSARSAAYGLIVTAGVLLAGEFFRRRSQSRGEGGRELGVRVALIVGFSQALAIWPGISRSGSTIAAGIFCGLTPTRAARFSFLLSIPVILGAALLKLPDAAGAKEGLAWGPLLWAGLFAGFVGWGALRMLLAFLGRGAFAWFAIYCVGLGCGALIFT